MEYNRNNGIVCYLLAKNLNHYISENRFISGKCLNIRLNMLMNFVLGFTYFLISSCIMVTLDLLIQHFPDEKKRHETTVAQFFVRWVIPYTPRNNCVLRLGLIWDVAACCNMFMTMSTTFSNGNFKATVPSIST